MSERFSMVPLVGALTDAWAELRAHRLRVLLSLLGIGIAVAALTAVVAFGEYQKQLMAEQSDRYGGRIATISMNVSSNDGSPVDWAAIDAHVAQVSERYSFSRTARVVDGSITAPVQLPDGVTPIATRLIDPDYPVIHRLTVAEGRWLRASDTQLLAPPVVISAPLWESLGSPPLTTHPTLTMTGELAGTYPIVGVTPREGVWDTNNKIDMLYDSYVARAGSLPAEAYVNREFWVPPAMVDELGPVLAMDLRAGLGEGLTLSLNRSDWGSQGGYADSILVFQLVSGAIAGIVLLLGALSLVNVQLIAMRQRIREIGVRRSFGATSGRVFAAVLLENLVATTVAGIVGIVLVVIVMRSEWVTSAMFSGLQDVPPFPFGAALAGLISAVVVGAAAGIIPALVALRVKVIDAIRF